MRFFTSIKYIMVMMGGFVFAPVIGAAEAPNVDSDIATIDFITQYTNLSALINQADDIEANYAAMRDDTLPRINLKNFLAAFGRAKTIEQRTNLLRLLFTHLRSALERLETSRFKSEAQKQSLLEKLDRWLGKNVVRASLPDEAGPAAKDDTFGKGDVSELESVSAEVPESKDSEPPASPAVASRAQSHPSAGEPARAPTRLSAFWGYITAGAAAVASAAAFFWRRRGARTDSPLPSPVAPPAPAEPSATAQPLPESLPEIQPQPADQPVILPTTSSGVQTEQDFSSAAGQSRGEELAHIPELQAELIAARQRLQTLDAENVRLHVELNEARDKLRQLRSSSAVREREQDVPERDRQAVRLTERVRVLELQLVETERRRLDMLKARVERFAQIYIDAVRTNKMSVQFEPGPKFDAGALKRNIDVKIQSRQNDFDALQDFYEYLAIKMGELSNEVALQKTRTEQARAQVVQAEEIRRGQQQDYQISDLSGRLEASQTEIARLNGLMRQQKVELDAQIKKQIEDAQTQLRAEKSKCTMLDGRIRELEQQLNVANTKAQQNALETDAAAQLAEQNEARHQEELEKLRSQLRGLQAQLAQSSDVIEIERARAARAETEVRKLDQEKKKHGESTSEKQMEKQIANFRAQLHQEQARGEKLLSENKQLNEQFTKDQQELSRLRNLIANGSMRAVPKGGIVPAAAPAFLDEEVAATEIQAAERGRQARASLVRDAQLRAEQAERSLANEKKVSAFRGKRMERAKLLKELADLNAELATRQSQRESAEQLNDLQRRNESLRMQVVQNQQEIEGLVAAATVAAAGRGDVDQDLVDLRSEREVLQERLTELEGHTRVFATETIKAKMAKFTATLYDLKEGSIHEVDNAILELEPHVIDARAHDINPWQVLFEVPGFKHLKGGARTLQGHLLYIINGSTWIGTPHKSIFRYALNRLHERYPEDIAAVP